MRAMILASKACKLFDRGGLHLMEDRRALAVPIDAVEHQAVQMNIFKLAVEPKRWMSVTAPVPAWRRFSPACLIRKVDSTHWRTGTGGMT